MASPLVETKLYIPKLRHGLGAVRPGATRHPGAGLIGAPLLIASATTALFRGHDPVTVLAAIATAPIFRWELSLGVWLVVKGCKPSPVTAGMVAATA